MSTGPPAFTKSRSCEPVDNRRNHPTRPRRPCDHFLHVSSTWPWLHGTGGLFGYHALFFTALKYAPAAEANLLNYPWPFLIVLLSAPVARAVQISVSMLCLAMPVRLEPHHVAMYSVLAGRFHEVPTQAVIGFCAAGALLAAIAHTLFEVSVMPTLPVMACVLLLGIGPVGGAFLLWDIDMKRGDPRLLGALAYGVPVASTVILGLAGFAPLSPVTVIAAILVTLGGLIAAGKAPRRNFCFSPLATPKRPFRIQGLTFDRLA
jgi:drug/metabolite transporter (DMT)-like permease